MTGANPNGGDFGLRARGQADRPASIKRSGTVGGAVSDRRAPSQRLQTPIRVAFAKVWKCRLKPT